MRPLFHDNAEKVRTAFADLLLSIKSIQGIRYSDVVPSDELFARLAVDSKPIVKKLCLLLANSFFPQGANAGANLNLIFFFLVTKVVLFTIDFTV